MKKIFSIILGMGCLIYTANAQEKSYTTQFLVNQSAEEVFNAIVNPRAWWSEDITGGTSQLNDEFKYRFKDVHNTHIKLVEVIPGKKVVWLVVQNQFSFTKDKSEWTGTKIIFEIGTKDNKTQLTFTHEGLVPEYECYKICNEGWANYINGSLHDLIAKGKGKPNPREGRGFNDEITEKWKLKQQ